MLNFGNFYGLTSCDMQYYQNTMVKIATICLPPCKGCNHASSRKNYPTILLMVYRPFFGVILAFFGNLMVKNAIATLPNTINSAHSQAKR